MQEVKQNPPTKRKKKKEKKNCWLWILLLFLKSRRVICSTPCKPKSFQRIENKNPMETCSLLGGFQVHVQNAMWTKPTYGSLCRSVKWISSTLLSWEQPLQFQATENNWRSPFPVHTTWDLFCQQYRNLLCTPLVPTSYHLSCQNYAPETYQGATSFDKKFLERGQVRITNPFSRLLCKQQSL